MKVAIVHDYIKEYGGAERVLEALHEIYPDAQVFTSVYLPKFLGPHRARFKDWKIKTSWAQYLPFKAKLISPLRLISSYLFKSFDLSDFDLIIVSATGAYFPNSLRLRSGQVHICYCHTPPRYLYGYTTARDWKKNVLLKITGEIANHFLRVVDFNSNQNVDFFIANSNEVRKRIMKFYRRDSVVIYPPVDVQSIKYEKNSKYKIQNTEYYLTGGRLARAKGTDIIIDSFLKLDKPLKVFGKGFAGFEEELRSKIKNPRSRQAKRGGQKSKIEFVGEVTDEEKLTLMKNAKAFVFASFDEDFGITPVEAMSRGVPVIAYNSGGVKETVINPSAGSGQATGILYEENTPDSLIDAIKKFEGLTIDPNDCIKQARKFSKERFQKEIKMFVEKVVNKDISTIKVKIPQLY